ncbi:Transcription factor SFL1 [Candida viswanathii]|uniref:Transcription factor SFL1 n=1 Tax=Candida viswanathii TaxID=5486 RepID=A0A367YA25_9ASCO|nr:Transcription factor SFL1 [Candida viswanathii]
MSNLVQPTPSITTPAPSSRPPLHISHSPSFVSNTAPSAQPQAARLSTSHIMNPPIDMKSNNLLNPSATTTTTTTTTTTAATTSTTVANNASTDAKGNNSNSTGKTQVVFIHKLYDMLHDDSISHLIWWSPSLDSFYVTPGEEFSRALSQYFKHTNIASFIRQLNMYGFHKVNETFLNQEDQQQQQQQSNRWEFRHSTNQFRKGDTESLKHIKRRSSKTLNAQKEIVNIKSLPPTSQPTDYAYSYQNEEANHYFTHHHSITSIHSPADNKPRSPSTPIPLQPYQAQLQFNGQPQIAMQQSPQEYIARPSIPAHSSYESATNFKLLELTNQVNLLRNDFFHMNSRCETLQNELKCQIVDSISVLDIVERLSKNDNRMGSDIRNLKNIINQRIQRINMIPMHQAPPVQQQQPGAQIQVPQPGQLPPGQQQQQQHHSSVSSYHIDSASSSRNPSAASIVPQAYPINPHYSIYSNSSDANNGFFRKREDSNNSKRNLSVFDPLQPVPSRHNSRILIEEASSNVTPNVAQQHAQQPPTFRSRAESTYSPLSNVGKSGNPQQQQQPPQPTVKPPTPINAPRIKSPLNELKHQQQQQQGQAPTASLAPPPPPPSTKQPIIHQPQQPPTQVQTSRTNSLPNPINDHLTPQSPYFIQRNSFTSVYEHQKSLRIPSPRFNTTPPRTVHENKESSSSTSVAKDNKELNAATSATSALPSVSELDKSIRKLVNLPPIMQHKDEHEHERNSNYSNDDNDTNKKRKLE